MPEDMRAPESPAENQDPDPEREKPMTWDQVLDENDVHEVVNADAKMYAEIDALPMDDENMVNNLIAIVENHVSGVWSPPRIAKLAHEFCLKPGFAYGLSTNNRNGTPWDFDRLEKRKQCMEDVFKLHPSFLIGSPMCTAFSALQALKKSRMSKEKLEALWEKGVRRMRFALKLYRLQAERGRWFLDGSCTKTHMRLHRGSSPR